MNTTRLTISILIAINLLLPGCAQHTTVRQHPDFASAEKLVKNILIIPPEVEIMMINATERDTHMPAREQEVLTLLQNNLPTILNTRGYTAKLADFKQLYDIDASRKLGELRKEYFSVMGQLYQTTHVEVARSTQFRVTAGPIVKDIADDTETDALLITRYKGFEKSSGMVVMEVTGDIFMEALFGVRQEQKPTNGGMLDAALIDGETGNVLWSNGNLHLQQRITGHTNLNRIFRILFSQLPHSDRQPKPLVPATK